MAEILIVDNQHPSRSALAAMLRAQGHRVDEAQTGALGRHWIDRREHDVVVTALSLPDLDGIVLLQAAKEVHPLTEVIVVTAYGTVESAVEAMRWGAFDYVQRQFAEEQLVLKVLKAVESRRLRGLVRLMAHELKEHHHFDNFVGRSSAIRDVMYRVVKLAPTDAPVLITGESGTGKGLVARALHANSQRATKPFVVVHCAALDAHLSDSELFGHARGAFSGAVAARRGLLEEAHGGTVFFDEIASMSLAVQAKLLRALQEGEVRRLGENRPTAVDVRVLIATNADLGEAVEQQLFRRDLYYRLNVACLHLPPLRERREDIPLHAQSVLDRLNARMGQRVRFATGALERLVAYGFPGNVRELENMVEQAAALTTTGLIETSLLMGLESSLPIARSRRRRSPGRRRGRSLARQIEEAERAAIAEVLRDCGGDRQRSADRLGISLSTLWRRMKALNLVDVPEASRIRLKAVAAPSAPAQSEAGGERFRR